MDVVGIPLATSGRIAAGRTIRISTGRIKPGLSQLLGEDGRLNITASSFALPREFLQGVAEDAKATWQTKLQSIESSM